MTIRVLAGVVAMAAFATPALAGQLVFTGALRGAHTSIGTAPLTFRFFDAATGRIAHEATALAVHMNGRYVASVPTGALKAARNYVPIVTPTSSVVGIATAFPPPPVIVTMVQLQGSTPGTKQTGNFNISGVGIAGQFTADGAGFFGVGSGLTSLNASNVATGTLSDARLSTNVMLLNNVQTVTATKTFAASPAFTNAATPFTVSSSALVVNLNADLLDGQSGLFYQNASNLNAGTVNDARLSANVALLNLAQTFSAAKTFGAGLSTTAFRLTTGPGAGRVLTSDAAGNGTWQVDGLTLPFAGAGNSTGDRGAVFTITENNSVDSGNAIRGVMGAASSVDLAPWQEAGVFGESNVNSGILGATSLSNGVGIFGFADAGANSAGAYGNTQSGEGIGVLGQATTGDGGRFVATSGDGVDASSSTGLAGRFTGNTLTSGDISKRFTASTSDPINMIAHGNISPSGTIAGGTPNFTSSFNSTTNEYTISVTGKTIDLFFDTAVVTPTTASAVVATTTTSGGDLIVRLWTLAGVRTQGRFQFVIWQPNRTDMRPGSGDPSDVGQVGPKMERGAESVNREVDLDSIGRRAVARP